MYSTSMAPAMPSSFSQSDWSKVEATMQTRQSDILTRSLTQQPRLGNQFCSLREGIGVQRCRPLAQRPVIEGCLCSLDRHRVQYHILVGLVLAPARNLGDFVHHVLAFDDFSEDGVIDGK